VATSVRFEQLLVKRRLLLTLGTASLIVLSVLAAVLVARELREIFPAIGSAGYVVAVVPFWLRRAAIRTWWQRARNTWSVLGLGVLRDYRQDRHRLIAEGAVPFVRPKMSVLINLMGALVGLSRFQMQQRRIDVLIAKFYVYGVDVLDNILDMYGRLYSMDELEAMLTRARTERQWPSLRLSADRLSLLEEQEIPKWRINDLAFELSEQDRAEGKVYTTDPGRFIEAEKRLRNWRDAEIELIYEAVRRLESGESVEQLHKDLLGPDLHIQHACIERRAFEFSESPDAVSRFARALRDHSPGVRDAVAVLQSRAKDISPARILEAWREAGQADDELRQVSHPGMGIGTLIAMPFLTSSTPIDSVRGAVVINRSDQFQDGTLELPLSIFDGATPSPIPSAHRLFLFHDVVNQQLYLHTGDFLEHVEQHVAPREERVYVITEIHRPSLALLSLARSMNGTGISGLLKLPSGTVVASTPRTFLTSHGPLVVPHIGGFPGEDHKGERRYASGPRRTRPSHRAWGLRQSAKGGQQTLQQLRREVEFQRLLDAQQSLRTLLNDLAPMPGRSRDKKDLYQSIRRRLEFAAELLRASVSG